MKVSADIHDACEVDGPGNVRKLKRCCENDSIAGVCVMTCCEVVNLLGVLVGRLNGVNGCVEKQLCVGSLDKALYDLSIATFDGPEGFS